MWSIHRTAQILSNCATCPHARKASSEVGFVQNPLWKIGSSVGACRRSQTDAGRRGMSYTEEDRVDDDATSRRGANEWNARVQTAKVEHPTEGF
jgi:hypothetical protein